MSEFQQDDGSVTAAATRNPNSELRIEQRHTDLARSAMQKSTYSIWPADAEAIIAKAFARFEARHMAPTEADVERELISIAQWASLMKRRQLTQQSAAGRSISASIQAIRAALRATPCADVAKLRKALQRWRDNLAITQTDPIAGEVLHGPALDFVIEQIDLLLASQDAPSTPPADVAKLREALEPILLFHESGGHEGDGSSEALAAARIELANFASQDAPSAPRADVAKLRKLVEWAADDFRVFSGVYGMLTDNDREHFRKCSDKFSAALQDAPSAPPSDDVERVDIRGIALAAIKRANQAGESNEMLARWISEDVNAAIRALASRKESGDA